METLAVAAEVARLRAWEDHLAHPLCGDPIAKALATGVLSEAPTEVAASMEAVLAAADVR